MSTAPTTFQIDGSGAGVLDHPADLYRPVGTIAVLPSLDAIGEPQLAAYREHGYIAAEGVFSADQIKSAMDALDDLVAGRNEAFNGVFYEAAAQDSLDKPDLQDRLDKVRKLANFVQFDDRLNALAHDPGIFEVVTKLLEGQTPALFQNMALLKPPRIGREKPWHQDHAYFDLDLKDPIIGVWIALDEATIDNGCMQVLDGGHKLGPMLHWKRRDWQICDTDMMGKTSLACPLKPGAGLFFNSLLPHGTPTNRSPLRRRALQFHYCAAAAGRIPTEQRLAVFGSDGKDVTC